LPNSSHFLRSKKSEKILFFREILLQSVSGKKQMQKFRGQNAKIWRKKYEREIIDYDMIKLLLSSQNKELCYFAQLIITSHRFHIYSLNHFREKMRNLAKYKRKLSSYFRIYSRTFLFAGNPSSNF